MRMSRYVARCLPWLLLTSLAAGKASGDEFQFGLRAGGNYSDNVERVPTGEQSTSAAVAGVDLDGQRTTGRFRYDILGNLEYQDYLESGVGSETFGQLFAQSSYAFIPERFDWRLSGSFGQTRRDLLRPVAPSNIEDVITLSTGPQWNVRFGSALEGTLEGHYTTADYSEQSFDSDTVGGSVIVGRRLSARSFIGLGGSADDVSYTSDGATSALDFDRREYFLRFTAEGARTHLELDAGYSELEGDSFSGDGPMARVHATRRLTPSWSGFAAYRRGFPTSEGAAFRPAISADVGMDSSVLTGAPRKTESAELGLELQAARTDATLSYMHREETQLGAVVRRNFDGLSASLTRTIASRASITLFAMFTEEELADTNDTNADERVYGGRINLRLGRLLSLNVRAEYRKRDSDVATGSYAETSGGLFLRYGNGTAP